MQERLEEGKVGTGVWVPVSNLFCIYFFRVQAAWLLLPRHFGYKDLDITQNLSLLLGKIF